MVSGRKTLVAIESAKSFWLSIYIYILDAHKLYFTCSLGIRFYNVKSLGSFVFKENCVLRNYVTVSLGDTGQA